MGRSITTQLLNWTDSQLHLLRQSNPQILKGETASTVLQPRPIAPRGAVAANGLCRLLECQDGWIALNLARDDDWSLIPAWLEDSQVELTWNGIARSVVRHSAAVLCERGRLMGLAISRPNEEVASTTNVKFLPCGQLRTNKRPRVLDLSALWAGPLAAHILRQTGMQVTKWESHSRPDQLWRSFPQLFHQLNRGKLRAGADLRTSDGRQSLYRTLASADIVIDSSRPRAMQQLGIDVLAFAEQHNLLWVSITAYGRETPCDHWVGFGDDVAVAAGAFDEQDGQLGFIADAVADPVTGLRAAQVALEHVERGVCGLLDVSMYGATVHALRSSVC